MGTCPLVTLLLNLDCLLTVHLFIFYSPKSAKVQGTISERNEEME
jgi:hypothetical protein